MVGLDIRSLESFRTRPDAVSRSHTLTDGLVQWLVLNLKLEGIYFPTEAQRNTRTNAADIVGIDMSLCEHNAMHVDRVRNNALHARFFLPTQRRDDYPPIHPFTIDFVYRPELGTGIIRINKTLPDVLSTFFPGTVDESDFFEALVILRDAIDALPQDRQGPAEKQARDALRRYSFPIRETPVDLARALVRRARAYFHI